MSAVAAADKLDLLQVAHVNRAACEQLLYVAGARIVAPVAHPTALLVDSRYLHGLRAYLTHTCPDVGKQ